MHHRIEDIWEIEAYKMVPLGLSPIQNLLEIVLLVVKEIHHCMEVVYSWTLPRETISWGGINWKRL